MFKKSLISLALITAVLTAPASVHAEDGVCVQVYGGGTVCGAKTPEEVVVHKPIEAGLGENLALLGAGLVSVSGVLLFLSKKARIQASL